MKTITTSYTKLMGIISKVRGRMVVDGNQIQYITATKLYVAKKTR